MVLSSNLITDKIAANSIWCPNGSIIYLSGTLLTWDTIISNVMGQDDISIQSIPIDNQILEMVDEFSYLGSTISSKLPLDAELNERMGKA